MAAFPAQLNRQYVPLKVRIEQALCFPLKVFASFTETILWYSKTYSLTVGKGIDKVTQGIKILPQNFYFQT